MVGDHSECTLRSRPKNKSLELIGPSTQFDWQMIADGVRTGDGRATQELYSRLQKFRPIIRRRLQHEQFVDDKLHDVFLIVVSAIKLECVKDPERLDGFIKAVAVHSTADQIKVMRHTRKHTSCPVVNGGLKDDRRTPEQAVLHAERLHTLRSRLAGLPERDREILTRFYFLDQSRETICEEMHLTDTQFRLLKSRAKARLARPAA
jgi:RNA polymerase sigma-70 factor, ECF subfamily